jgi:hypothetical protein
MIFRAIALSAFISPPNAWILLIVLICSLNSSQVGDMWQVPASFSAATDQSYL